MWSLIRTIWNVLLHTFHRRVTIQYPEEKAYLAPRTRGRIILSRDPDGGERCVACHLVRGRLSGGLHRAAGDRRRKRAPLSGVFPNQFLALYFLRLL